MYQSIILVFASEVARAQVTTGAGYVTAMCDRRAPH